MRAKTTAFLGKMLGSSAMRERSVCEDSCSLKLTQRLQFVSEPSRPPHRAQRSSKPLHQYPHYPNYTDRIASRLLILTYLALLPPHQIFRSPSLRFDMTTLILRSKTLTNVLSLSYVNEHALPHRQELSPMTLHKATYRNAPNGGV